ncbi:hypothetical protein GCM10009716_20660 [Streptomyces sodiiphilus]|uniref:Aminoglycoside phosphotransferase domain-containing protein n=1 Tax=Streptomyces sodiiphilus TaxID=226217 RepID=A0ABN2P2M4_9ACTN
MTLHENEIPTHETLVRSLLKEQCPEWADLPLSLAGAGTENTMYRLGEDLLVRLPRTADKQQAIRKEQEWLPRLAPFLSCPIPEPVHSGVPARSFPLVWSVHRWIDGAEAGPDTVRDWATFGADLATVVRELRGADLMGATRTDALSWYRGGSLKPCDQWVGKCLADCRTLMGSELTGTAAGKSLEISGQANVADRSDVLDEGRGDAVGALSSHSWLHCCERSHIVSPMSRRSIPAARVRSAAAGRDRCRSSAGRASPAMEAE